MTSCDLHAPQGGRTCHLPPVAPRRPVLALTWGFLFSRKTCLFAKLHIQKHYFAEMGVLRSFTTGKSTFFVTMTGSVGHAKDLVELGRTGLWFLPCIGACRASSFKFRGIPFRAKAGSDEADVARAWHPVLFTLKLPAVQGFLRLCSRVDRPGLPLRPSGLVSERHRVPETCVPMFPGPGSSTVRRPLLLLRSDVKFCIFHI